MIFKTLFSVVYRRCIQVQAGTERIAGGSTHIRESARSECWFTVDFRRMLFSTAFPCPQQERSM